MIARVLHPAPQTRLSVCESCSLPWRCLRWSASDSPCSNEFSNEHTVRRTIELVESVLLLGRPLVQPGCLTRGVTLHYFLRRAGVDVRLCFGIGHPDGKKIAGHCWLEVDRRPFLERCDPRAVFVETYRIPSALARA